MSKCAQKNPGALVISLDFEMFWGMADVSAASNLASSMRRVHEVVPRLLKLFETYGVHATWATVGGMMAHDDAEFLRYLPKPAAPQTARMLDKLGIGQPDGAKKCPREILYAPELIHKVAATPGQEIGTHTYSHYYCSNADSTPEAFAAERGEVYHTYWHPHNFTEYTENNFRQLERFLAYYQKQRDRYGMQSLNMSELCRLEVPDHI